MGDEFSRVRFASKCSQIEKFEKNYNSEKKDMRNLLNSILNNILVKNNDLVREAFSVDDFCIIITDNFDSVAISTEEKYFGVIEVGVDYLKNMKDVDAIAFTFAHELAHVFRSHLFYINRNLPIQFNRDIFNMKERELIKALDSNEAKMKVLRSSFINILHELKLKTNNAEIRSRLEQYLAYFVLNDKVSTLGLAESFLPLEALLQGIEGQPLSSFFIRFRSLNRSYEKVLEELGLALDTSEEYLEELIALDPLKEEMGQVSIEIDADKVGVYLYLNAGFKPERNLLKPFVKSSACNDSPEFSLSEGGTHQDPCWRNWFVNKLMFSGGNSKEFFLDTSDLQKEYSRLLEFI